MYTSIPPDETRDPLRHPQTNKDSSQTHIKLHLKKTTQNNLPHNTETHAYYNKNILVDVLLFIALILIYYIDQIVNGTLYYYGLISDNGWLQPYFLLSRIIAILIIAAIFVISSVELPISALKEEN